MFTLSHSIATLALVLVGLGLQAEDFSSLMQVTRETWPEKTHIGVLCDYRYSRPQVEALARAAGPESTITVAEIHRSDQANIGAQTVANSKADFLVLLPEDRLAGDGSLTATVAIRNLAQRGIPSVGTTPKALAQGAVFSIGDGTHGEVLVTDRTIGTVTVTLPAGIGFSRKSSLSLGPCMATITLGGEK